MAWHPTPEETFVFRNRRTNEVIVILKPPKTRVPEDVKVNGFSYVLDEDLTEKTRMYVSVDNRKRALDN